MSPKRMQLAVGVRLTGRMRTVLAALPSAEEHHTLLLRVAMPSDPQVNDSMEAGSSIGLPTLGSSMPGFIRSSESTCKYGSTWT